MNQHYEFECAWCDAVFDQRMPDGSCPCCGAPKPKRKAVQVPNELIVVRTVCVEVPDAPKRLEYAYPRQPSVKSRLYSNLGYRLGNVVLVALSAFVVWAFIAAFRVGQRDALTDERLRHEAPTAVVVEPSVPVVPEVSFLNDTTLQWYSAFDSVELRQHENVVNLIVLGPDEVRILRDKSIRLTEEWQQVVPFFVDAVSVNGTAAIVEINDQQYHINVYMPFMIESVPSLVAMVDESRNLWTISADQVVLVDLTALELPVTVEPNPNLELAFSKQ